MNKYKYSLSKTNNTIFNSELNHHSPQSRHSGPLDRVLPTFHRRWNSSSQKPAFTIIGVVLVLAIAGLIFLMVFIALPALQRSQRDNQRKQDVGRLQSAMESCKANNRGQIPTIGWIADVSTDSPFARTYLKADQGEFKDPDGSNYAFWVPAVGSGFQAGMKTVLLEVR